MLVLIQEQAFNYFSIYLRINFLLYLSNQFVHTLNLLSLLPLEVGYEILKLVSTTVYISANRAVGSVESFCDFFSFALPLLRDWFKFSCHNLSQSKTRAKSFLGCLHTLSRDLRRLPVRPSRCDWLITTSSTLTSVMKSQSYFLVLRRALKVSKSSYLSSLFILLNAISAQWKKTPMDPDNPGPLVPHIADCILSLYNGPLQRNEGNVKMKMRSS